jgi:hypothetical protein
MSFVLDNLNKGEHILHDRQVSWAAYWPLLLLALVLIPATTHPLDLAAADFWLLA